MYLSFYHLALVSKRFPLHCFTSILTEIMVCYHCVALHAAISVPAESKTLHHNWGRIWTGGKTKKNTGVLCTVAISSLNHRCMSHGEQDNLSTMGISPSPVETAPPGHCCTLQPPKECCPLLASLRSLGKSPQHSSKHHCDPLSNASFKEHTGEKLSCQPRDSPYYSILCLISKNALFGGESCIPLWAVL